MTKNLKNMFLKMYALSPSIFELIMSKMVTFVVSISETFPKVHYALVSTLYSHCSRFEKRAFFTFNNNFDLLNNNFDLKT